MKLQIGKLSKDWAEKSQIPVWYEPSTTSTNLMAKEAAMTDQPVSLFLCDHQTAGRGRGQHRWLDPEEGGDCFLSSWVFLMRNPPQPVLAPAIGLAVWTALKASFPWLKLSLKAPNDIYLEDRKMAGILIESIQQGKHTRLIIGIGMNIFKFPEELEGAIALGDRCSKELTETTWLNVLDRLLLEISLAVSQTKETLSYTQSQALLNALNRFPFLEVPYRQVDPDGSLWKGESKINWSEL